MLTCTKHCGGFCRISLKAAATAAMVAFNTLGGLDTKNAPRAEPPMVAISKGKALAKTSTLPPCNIYTPKTQPKAIT